MLGSGINLIWCHFYSCLLSNWLFAEKFSNCSNSLNFEAKINCNTIKPNVPKWRKTCTGLKFDLLHFYGPQSHILSGGNLWGPCTYLVFLHIRIWNTFYTQYQDHKYLLMWCDTVNEQYLSISSEYLLVIQSPMVSLFWHSLASWSSSRNESVTQKISSLQNAFEKLDMERWKYCI